MKWGILKKTFLITIFFVFVLGLFTPINTQAMISGVGSAENRGTPDASGKVGYVEQAAVHLMKTGAWAIVSGSGIVMGWAGSLFDYAVQETVLNANANFSSGEMGSIVNTIWKIARDIGNIIIIFSLLYLAIKTIIEGNGFADKKVLAGILLAAVFINFSLFFTKVIFEFSNEVSVTIYNQIKISAAGSGIFQGGNQTEGIGVYIGKLVGLGEITEKLAKLDDGTLWSTVWSTLGRAVFLTVIFIILTFVLGAATALLFIRMLIFLFLMLFSPIGLSAKFIPFLSSVGEKWWDQLKKQALVLPAFFLMLFIALYASGQIVGTGLESFELSGTNGVDPDLIQYLYKFAILIALLMSAIFVPVMVGAKGASVLTAAGNKLKGVGKASLDWGKRRAGGLTAGTAAYAGRQGVRAVGGGLTKLKITDKLKKAAPNNALARMTLRAGDKVQSSSLDARNIKIGGKSVGSRLGVGEASKAASGGVKGIAEAKAEKMKKRYDSDMKIFGEGFKQKAAGINESKKQKKEKLNENIKRIEEEIAHKEREIEKGINVSQNDSDAGVLNKSLERQKGQLADISKVKDVNEKQVYAEMLTDKTKTKWNKFTNLFIVRNKALEAAAKKISKEESKADKFLKDLEKKIKKDSDKSSDKDKKE